jgi:hypothetical protein
MILDNDRNTARAQYQQLLDTRTCFVTIVGQRDAAYQEATYQAQGDGTRRACMAPDPNVILDLANQYGGFTAQADDLIWAHSVHDRKLVYIARNGAQAGDDAFAIDTAFLYTTQRPGEREGGR